MNDNEKFFLCIKNWLTVFLPKQRCLSENSIKAYKMTLNLLIEFLRTEKGLAVKNISFSIFNQSLICDFIEWLADVRKCSILTQNSRLMALRSFFHYAAICDISLAALELEILKVPVKKSKGKTVEYLSERALKTLLDTPDANTKIGLRNRFFMILMYDTAARCQELLDLKIKDFVLRTEKPYVCLTGKGNKQRSVPLLPKTVKHYEQYLQNFHGDCPLSEDYVFYTVTYGIKHQMSEDNAEAFMKKYGKKARERCNEVPERVHPHQLRHTRAIHLYRSGVPLPFVAELLGHVNMTTTNIYAYADTEMKRKALEKVALSTAPAIFNQKPLWKDDEDMILKLSGLR
jgi:site-specific recombinase XerD